MEGEAAVRVEQELQRGSGDFSFFYDYYDFFRTSLNLFKHKYGKSCLKPEEMYNNILYMMDMVVTAHHVKEQKFGLMHEHIKALQRVHHERTNLKASKRHA